MADLKRTPALSPAIPGCRHEVLTGLSAALWTDADKAYLEIRDLIEAYGLAVVRTAFEQATAEEAARRA